MAIQILRTIDKFDKLGRNGVVELLQKPVEEFGADLDPVRAELIGQFLDTQGSTNKETLQNLSSLMKHATRIGRRLKLMEALEEAGVWDRFLAMPTNADETWNNNGRPHNIGWALDDILEIISCCNSTSTPPGT